MTADEKKIADQDLLQALALQELEINQLAMGLQGSLAESKRFLQQQGIFEQYRQIHKAYVALSSFKRDRATRNEALKRALFLSWYQFVEPPVFTGLADLDEDTVTEAYFVLNRGMERGWLNEELHWMLQHYAQWDWAILQFTENKIHEVTKWVKAIRQQPAALTAVSPAKGSMHGRGLMGLYFKEIGPEADAETTAP